METVYLLKSPANAEHLRKSIEQYREGKLRKGVYWMSRNLAWTEVAWSDYVYWQGQDKKQ